MDRYLRFVAGAILALTFSAQSTSAAPRERQIELRLLVHYADFFKANPAYPLAKAATELEQALRVYVDGKDIGAFELDAAETYHIPAGSKTLVLKQRAAWPCFFFCDPSQASDELNIQGRAIDGTLNVKCSMHIGLYWFACELR